MPATDNQLPELTAFQLKAETRRPRLSGRGQVCGFLPTFRKTENTVKASIATFVTSHLSPEIRGLHHLLRCCHCCFGNKQ